MFNFSYSCYIDSPELQRTEILHQGTIKFQGRHDKNIQSNFLSEDKEPADDCFVVGNVSDNRHDVQFLPYREIALLAEDNGSNEFHLFCSLSDGDRISQHCV